jgi:branched-chain amino acid transport system substrate-binding protein
MNRRTLLPLLLGGVLACETPPPSQEEIPIGLLLSYTGYLAANSINSERALRMAVESVNAAGGVAGQRRVRLLARDTRSQLDKVVSATEALIDAGAVMFIGPDTTDLVTQLSTHLEDRTVILPSLETSSDVEWQEGNWFVMGASTGRVACELVSQLRADGRQKPILLVNPTGQNNALSWDLGLTYGMPKVILPSNEIATQDSVRALTRELVGADAYVLAAFPASASSLIYALAAAGELRDPRSWYLSPTLHTPAFLESIPKGVLQGARGVASGTVSGAADFRAAFQKRWQDTPLDDAYPFFDAGAIVALALERAFLKEGAIPTGSGLADHIRAVTRAGGTPVQWDHLEMGLDLLRRGQEIEYFGLSGLIQFDSRGQTRTASTRWWTIDGGAFTDIPHEGNCR